MAIKIAPHLPATPVFEPGRVYLETQVAEVLQVPRQNLARWRHQAVGPKFVKLGRWVRYTGADLNAWLRANSVQTTNH